MFKTFDFTNLQTEASWLFIIYIAVLIAMSIDLITGIRKAKVKGELTTSKMLRKTAEKAMQYLLPMLCLTLIDAIASVHLNFPYLTAGLGAFNIYIELVSVWENTHTKEETKKQEQCAEDLIVFVKDHWDDIQKIIK